MMYRPATREISSSCPIASRSDVAFAHRTQIGIAASVKMMSARWRTPPSDEYALAPNAAPHSVVTALAMPTMMEFPVTFPSVVASAAPASGSGPR